MTAKAIILKSQPANQSRLSGLTNFYYGRPCTVWLCWFWWQRIKRVSTLWFHHVAATRSNVSQEMLSKESKHRPRAAKQPHLLKEHHHGHNWNQNPNHSRNNNALIQCVRHLPLMLTCHRLGQPAICNTQAVVNPNTGWYYPPHPQQMIPTYPFCPPPSRGSSAQWPMQMMLV